MIPDIKTIVKDNTAEFDYLRGDYAYYVISVIVPQEMYNALYRFPVELKDLDGATIHHSEKGISMMRFIRKAIAEETFIKL